MPRPAVDIAAKEAHFLDHLLPIWQAIPPAERGHVYVPLGVREHATARGLTEATGLRIGSPTKTSDAATVVASWGDLRILDRTRRRAILAEHGAGQSYSNRHSSYVGGVGRERVKLFVVPNHAAAERNRRYYPRIPNAVVGSPRVDLLRSIERRAGRRPIVAISFHWRALEHSVPEAGTAVEHYLGGRGAPERHLLALCHELDRRGVGLIGHGHPRIMAELEPIYRAAAIRPVASFEEVVRIADLYAVDNSSTLFEFAALDRPVVVLNSPKYRRDVDHGLRFWRDSSVGLHVDHPEQLAEVILEALEDPPAVARSREATIARVYPVRDGTSAARAATAVRSLAAKRCVICGAAHAVCGTTAENLDDVVDLPGGDPTVSKSRGRKRMYRNPDHPSSFLRLDDVDAARLGLLTEAEAGEVAPYVNDPTLGLVGAGPVGADEVVVDVPSGALSPGGPTHRARAAAAAEAAAEDLAAAGGTVDDVVAAGEALADAGVTLDEAGAKAVAPPEPTDPVEAPADPEADPQHKKVQQPDKGTTRTRRRRVADESA